MKIADEVIQEFYEREAEFEQAIRNFDGLIGEYVELPFFAPGIYARWNVSQERFILIRYERHFKGKRVESTVILNKTREYLKR